MQQFSLDYDRDYGIDRRSGWSVTLNGSVMTEFERGPVRAIVKAFWRAWRRWEPWVWGL